jgi:hypothetical protein
MSQHLDTPKRRRGRTWSMALAVGLLAPATVGLGSPANAGSEREELDRDRDAASEEIDWQLEYVEQFGKPIGRDVEWELDDLSDQYGPFDDDGEAFHIKGGEVFAEALDSFDTYRASYQFGRDGWLTAELATRDQGKTGELGEVPSFTNDVVPGVGRVGKFDLPNNTDGAIIRPTEPLPDRYRVEYELTTLDFGGPRDGEWNYDGLINGYGPEGCKTQHPWTASVGQPTSPEYCDFADVRGENGFYFLGIVDYPDPAPRNNVFIHNRRKVVMDQYQVSHSWGANYQACDPTTGETYSHHDERSGDGIPINMLFLTDDNQRDTGFIYNEFMMETDCGFFHGGDPGTSIVSAGELRPDLMPDETYRFAIERTGHSYVLEVSGEFLHGEDTLRFERDFIQDGHPIWHYNQTPDEYDGRFDRQHTIDGPYGSYDMGSIWPSDSAYPDYFIIGNPHTNYYEGSATMNNLRLYLPKS